MDKPEFYKAIRTLLVNGLNGIPVEPEFNPNTNPKKQVVMLFIEESIVGLQHGGSFVSGKVINVPLLCCHTSPALLDSLVVSVKNIIKESDYNLIDILEIDNTEIVNSNKYFKSIVTFVFRE
jgi:hypothetical protein